MTGLGILIACISIIILSFIAGMIYKEMITEHPPDLIIYDLDGRHLCEIRKYMAGVLTFIEAVNMKNGKVVFQVWSEFEGDAKTQFMTKLEKRGSYELFNQDALS